MSAGPSASFQLRRTAERLVLTKIGVIAFSSSGNQELGEYDDDPVIIFKTGRLPQQFDDLGVTGNRYKVL